MQAEGAKASGWLGLAPVIALIVFALLQISLSATRDLTPWKGGGFGMFSTVDQPRIRFVQVFVELADGQTLFIPPAPATRKARLRAASYPVEATLQAVAQRVIDRVRANGKDAVGARVVYFKREFDAGTGELRPVRIGEARFGRTAHD
jgi:hypothetical protein